MSTETTLLSLNVYCIWEICKHLNLGDQISLSFTCKDLQFLVSSTSRRVQLMGDSVLFYNLNTIAMFMKCIKNDVRELIIDYDKYFHNIRKIKFPFVTKLDLYFMHSTHNLKYLPKMFPMLETLRFNGVEANFKNLWRFKNLQHLHISYKGTPKYCEKFFKNSHLKTLSIFQFCGNCCKQLVQEDLEIIFECKEIESLSTTAHQMQALVSGLGGFPKLKKLVYRDVYCKHENVVYEIAKKYPENVKGVYFCSAMGITFFNYRNYVLSLYFVTNEIDIEFKYDRKFIWIEFGNCNFPSRLPTLSDENKAELINLLSHWKTLEYFEICGIKLEINFLGKIIKEIISKNDQRKKPLELLFYNTNLTIDHFKDFDFGPMVNVSVESGKEKRFGTHPVLYLDWKARQ